MGPDHSGGLLSDLEASIPTDKLVFSSGSDIPILC